jgi:hypothetical protein
LFTLKNRSLFIKSLSGQIFFGLLIAVASLALSSCHSAQYYYYKFPQYTFANRPIPPSKLAQRVMIAYTLNGAATSTSALGGLQIVDAKRDIRSNIEGTIASFPVSGYSGGYPSQIFNFPEEIHGYVFSSATGDGTLAIIDYSKEAAAGTAGKFPNASSIAIPATFNHYYAAIESSGQLVIVDNTVGITYALNIPNIYKVAANQGDTVVLAMVRNSNTIYRLIKLNSNLFQTSVQAIAATGAADCQPANLPVYCAVPVNTAVGSNPNTLDRPTGAYFSLDGTTAFVLNCGPECGGTTASLTLLQQGTLNVNTIPNASPDNSAFISNVPVPGGATVALSDGTTLYVAGQQQMPDGLFAGFLSTINLAAAATSPSTAVTGKYSISDGTHTKLLFADNNTLWIGSQYCATGERQKLNQNYNCLTRFDRGANTAQVVPNVNPGSTPTVGFPNTNQNQYYYGDLTGLCWVQGFNKIYTAYGGQVHIFSTVDGSEIDNEFVTVQGSALDVAYLDAVTNADN